MWENWLKNNRNTKKEPVFLRIPFKNYIELTKDLGYESELFLLPMVMISEDEEVEFREIVEDIIANFNIQKSCEKQIVEIIVNNCLS